MSNELTLKQIQKLKLKSEINDQLMYEQYLGKKVVLEEGETGNNISIGTLTNNGFNLVELIDYKKYLLSIYDITDFRCEDGINSYVHLKFKEPVINLNKKVIEKSRIGSIQSLEDVLKGTKFESLLNE